jgi:hypothetical protein
MDVVDEHPPGRDWLAIISRPTMGEFASAFNVVVYATLAATNDSAATGERYAIGAMDSFREA